MEPRQPRLDFILLLCGVLSDVTMKYPTREEYRLLSFELTDKFSAWFTGDDGVEFESPIHAIGMASLATLYVIPTTGETHRTKEWGNVLVGIQFTDDGIDICNESSNFAFILPKGQKPQPSA